MKKIVFFAAALISFFAAAQQKVADTLQNKEKEIEEITIVASSRTDRK
jgi:hypothetical protein